VALREHNIISYYYVDSIGFQELPGFNAKNNPLRNLEDSVEQNDNNLDGIINNLPPVKALDSVTEQKEKKKSIREKLQQSPKSQLKRKPIEIMNGRNEYEPINL
ncbi:MAG: DUF4316 domain-containing protein, partial [Mobilitalea sp.]